MGNTWCKKNINKYTWEMVGRGTAIDKALMDYLLIFKNVRNRLLDVHVYRGALRGTSDHYLVEGKVRVAERWGTIRGVGVGWMRIRERGLRKKEKSITKR